MICTAETLEPLASRPKRPLSERCYAINTVVLVSFMQWVRTWPATRGLHGAWMGLLLLQIIRRVLPLVSADQWCHHILVHGRGACGKRRPLLAVIGQYPQRTNKHTHLHFYPMTVSFNQQRTNKHTHLHVYPMTVSFIQRRNYGCRRSTSAHPKPIRSAMDLS